MWIVHWKEAKAQAPVSHIILKDECAFGCSGISLTHSLYLLSLSLSLSHSLSLTLINDSRVFPLFM